MIPKIRVQIEWRPLGEYPWLAATLRFLLALAGAMVLQQRIWQVLPRKLDIQTDVVGYPIFADFNIYMYFWAYHLTLLFLPVATLAIYFLLSRLFPAKRSLVLPSFLTEEAPDKPAPQPGSMVGQWIVRWGSVLIPGIIVGLEAHAAWGEPSQTESRLVTVAFFYVAAAILLRSIPLPGAPQGMTHWGRLSLANALLMPLPVAGLYAVSRATEVKILSTGSIQPFPWLPWWLAALAALGLLLLVVERLRRSRSQDDIFVLERGVLLYACVPAAIFLFTARLPGAFGGVDFFHWGETLASAEWTRAGWFPWRDLVYIHGILQDPLRSMLGMELFDHSVWGAFAGEMIILTPAYWILLYFFFLYLFRNNLPAVIVVLAVSLYYNFVHTRFLFVPVVYLAFAALLARSTPTRAFLFIYLMGANNIVSPEFGYAAIALGLTLPLYELYHADRKRRWLENFRGTVWCAIAGCTFVALWTGFLLYHGALGDFFHYYRTFAPDHPLTGGIPLQWNWRTWKQADLTFILVAPVAAVLLVFWYFVAFIRLGRRLTDEDWLVAGIAIFSAMYYQKGISRADLHIATPFVTVFPVLAYLAFKLVGGADRWVAHVRPRRMRWASRPVTWVFVVVALGQVGSFTSHGKLNRARDLPRVFSVSVSEPPQNKLLGFGALPEDNRIFLKDMGSVLDALLDPEDSVFDFTNTPGLYHYFLGRRPATRYYHVSMAIRAHTQADLIQKLTEARPKVVVFSGRRGLGSWDGVPNMVRHYDISEYLLRHYRPYLDLQGEVLMVRNDLDLPPPLHVRGWAADIEAKQPAREVLAVLDGKVAARTIPHMPRPDVAQQLGQAGLAQSGFDLVVPWGHSAHIQDTKALRYYAVLSNGKTAELPAAESRAISVGPARPSAAAKTKPRPALEAAQENHGRVDFAAQGDDPAKLYFSVGACDWGYAPSFLRWRDKAATITIGSNFTALVDFQVNGWAVDTEAHKPAREIVAIYDGSVVARTAPSLPRPDVAKALGDPSYQRSGFSFPVAVAQKVGEDARKLLRVFAVTEGGHAIELNYNPQVGHSPSAALPVTIATDKHSTVRVGSGQAGSVDSLVARATFAITLPQGSKAQDFNWLEIHAPGGLQPGRFVLSDTINPDNASRGITFQATDRAPATYRVQVGSCPQWYGYNGSKLYLQSPSPQAGIESIRLLE
jgi:hypothetical protein